MIRVIGEITEELKEIVINAIEDCSYAIHGSGIIGVNSLTGKAVGLALEDNNIKDAAKKVYTKQRIAEFMESLNSCTDFFAFSQKWVQINSRGTLVPQTTIKREDKEKQLNCLETLKALIKEA